MTPAPLPAQPLRLGRLYAVGVQCIATALGFFLTAVVKLPMPLYFPLSRRWSTAPNPEELSIDFFGRSLVAIVVGALAGALTLAVFQVRARVSGQPTPVADPEQSPQLAPVPYSGLILLTVYAATALALGMGVFAYQLYGRAPVPEPLPPGLSTLQTAQKPSAIRPVKGPPQRPTPAPAEPDDPADP